MKWEYKIYVLDINEEVLTAANKLGEEDWELLQFVRTIGNSLNDILIFKRQIDQTGGVFKP